MRLLPVPTISDAPHADDVNANVGDIADTNDNDDNEDNNNDDENAAVEDTPTDNAPSNSKAQDVRYHGDEHGDCACA
jgi:hypothetical protein